MSTNARSYKNGKFHKIVRLLSFWAILMKSEKFTNFAKNGNFCYTARHKEINGRATNTRNFTKTARFTKFAKCCSFCWTARHKEINARAGKTTNFTKTANFTKNHGASVKTAKLTEISNVNRKDTRVMAAEPNKKGKLAKTAKFTNSLKVTKIRKKLANCKFHENTNYESDSFLEIMTSRLEEVWLFVHATFIKAGAKNREIVTYGWRPKYSPVKVRSTHSKCRKPCFVAIRDF